MKLNRWVASFVAIGLLAVGSPVYLQTALADEMKEQMKEGMKEEVKEGAKDTAHEKKAKKKSGKKHGKDDKHKAKAGENGMKDEK